MAKPNLKSITQKHLAQIKNSKIKTNKKLFFLQKYKMQNTSSSEESINLIYSMQTFCLCAENIRKGQNLDNYPLIDSLTVSPSDESLFLQVKINYNGIMVLV